jgi:hypothetical protein
MLNTVGQVNSQTLVFGEILSDYSYNRFLLSNLSKSELPTFQKG